MTIDVKERKLAAVAAKERRANIFERRDGSANVQASAIRAKDCGRRRGNDDG